MTAVIAETPVDVTDDLTRAQEVVANARSDPHTALVAHTNLLTIEMLAQQVAQAEQALRKERDDWTDWIQFAVDRSREVAGPTPSDNWCSVYDTVMERLGLPPRPTPEPVMEDVGWRVDVTLSKTVDDDDVIRTVTTDDMRRRHTFEVDDRPVVTVEVTVSGEMEVEEGSCVCDSIDHDDISNNLPDDFADWEIENRTGYRCDNCD